MPARGWGDGDARASRRTAAPVGRPWSLVLAAQPDDQIDAGHFHARGWGRQVAEFHRS